MARAVVSLGSNIGDRAAHLKRAVELLSVLPETKFVKASGIIETEPVDVPEEFSGMKFLNQAAVFETNLSPHEFSDRMLAIEDDM